MEKEPPCERARREQRREVFEIAASYTTDFEAPTALASQDQEREPMLGLLAVRVLSSKVYAAIHRRTRLRMLRSSSVASARERVAMLDAARTAAMFRERYQLGSG